MKQILITILIILILPSVTFSDQSTIEKQNRDRTEKMQTVKIEDGINNEEAEILCSEYFWRYISGCGYAGKPIDEGDNWSSIACFGIAGTPLEYKIKINKNTGTISMKGYPTIAKPLKEWKIIP